MAVQSIDWATTSESSHINAMSLKVRQLVKKLSAVFKDEPTTLPTPNITLAWYKAMPFPPLPLSFVPIFKIPNHLPPSVEIVNLEQQVMCIDHFIDLIDKICEDNLPISWDDIRYQQPQETIAELLAKRLRTHFTTLV